MFRTIPQSLSNLLVHLIFSRNPAQVRGCLRRALPMGL